MLGVACGPAPIPESPGPEFTITEDDDQVLIASSTLEAAIRKRGYVSGVYRQSFLDKETGFRDAGFELDIADFILEPGSDEAHRDGLDERLTYKFNNLVHGNIPQICTQAKELSPTIIEGRDFGAAKMSFEYYLAAPGRSTGSVWEQTIVFPAGKRYCISSQKIMSKNAADEMFLRIDMPGHVRHERGDTFSEVYLSYAGRIPSSEFFEDFPPHAKFNYRRGRDEAPERFIRAYHLRVGSRSHNLRLDVNRLGGHRFAGRRSVHRRLRLCALLRRLVQVLDTVFVDHQVRPVLAIQFEAGLVVPLDYALKYFAVRKNQDHRRPVLHLLDVVEVLGIGLPGRCAMPFTGRSAVLSIGMPLWGRGLLPQLTQ